MSLSGRNEKQAPAWEDACMEMVGTVGIEPTTPTVSMWCSPTELRAYRKLLSFVYTRDRRPQSRFLTKNRELEWGSNASLTSHGPPGTSGSRTHGSYRVSAQPQALRFRRAQWNTPAVVPNALPDRAQSAFCQDEFPVEYASQARGPTDSNL